MLGADCQRDSATRGELRGQDGFTRCARFDEIIEDAVRDGLIERALVTIRCKIEFQRFAFNAQLVGHIIDVNPREIRLTGYRTNGSEIVGFEMNAVVSFRSRISKRLQARFGRR